jgi:alkanesulfonate monooxygenase
MPVEFLGIAGVNPASEVTPRRGGVLDLEYTRRLARAHEDNGWDRILFAYHSGSPDPAQVAAYVAGHTERINLVIAHRPNVSAPTFFAKTIATLDHLSGGRAEVHFITGGSTADQAAEGDHLDKDTRYERTREYIRIVKQAWTAPSAFDFAGSHYDIRGYRPDIRPVQQPRPRISFGGSSEAAYRVGAAESDVYALWGEPLAGTRQQIASIDAAAAAAGRDRPRLQIAFRPIIAPTEELAWAKAESILGRIGSTAAGRPPPARTAPENAGSQRLLSAIKDADRHDRALWTAPTRLTGGQGNSTALVGTPDTVAAALLDYYDLGITLLSARGYDIYDDAIDFGRYVIPLVRQEVADRDAATARSRGAADHPPAGGIDTATTSPTPNPAPNPTDPRTAVLAGATR